MSIPTSPTSPTHKRRSLRLSSFEVSQDASPSPYTSGTTNGTSYSRRSSRTSQTSFMQSPGTPRAMSIRSSRPPSFYDRRKSSSRLSVGSIGSNISFGANEGLGNLADELEDALEDEYEMNGGGYLDGLREGGVEPLQSPTHSNHEIYDVYDDVLNANTQSPNFEYGSAQQPPIESPNRSRSERRRNRHERTISKYDGSDYGPESDQDENGISLALAKRMRDIESLVRMNANTEDLLSEGGGVIKRSTHELKDLGQQASIETNLSRIIAAYTSMATHRTHKTRELFGLAHSVLYGGLMGLPEDMIDDLISNLEMLSTTVPFVQQENPLLSLHMLASQTLDLAHTLRSLTDVLQESRVQANTATRKLKSVKDMVDDICAEQELIETSIILIQAGDWDRRCRERQAAATCREVIMGFGERWNLEPEDRPWMREPEGILS